MKKESLMVTNSSLELKGTAEGNLKRFTEILWNKGFHGDHAFIEALRKEDPAGGFEVLSKTPQGNCSTNITHQRTTKTPREEIRPPHIQRRFRGRLPVRSTRAK
jgi:hypothetical protein